MPDQIYNTDETGFVTDPKSDVVLARRGSRRVNQTIGGSGKEQITVNCAGSASGCVLPPYVVYKGKNLYKDWVCGGPQGAVYTTSLNGWMESDQFMEWFKTIFLKCTAAFSQHPRILIFDGHLSHLSLDMIKHARETNVILLRLPSKLTHLLQPFDRTVFRPVKQKWQSLLRQYARTNRGPVGKNEFPGMLKKLYEESFTKSTIEAGFRSTGICPFEPSVVKLDDHRPSPMPSSRLLQFPVLIHPIHLRQLHHFQSLHLHWMTQFHLPRFHQRPLHLPRFHLRPHLQRSYYPVHLWRLFHQHHHHQIMRQLQPHLLLLQQLPPLPPQHR